MSAMKTYGNPPSSLLRACERHADKIAEVGNEGDDGYWVYLKDGWWSRDSETSAIHEHTVRECLQALRTIEKDPRT